MLMQNRGPGANLTQLSTCQGNISMLDIKPFEYVRLLLLQAHNVQS